MFQHDKGEFTLDLKDAQGSFSVEWFDVNGGQDDRGEGGAGRGDEDVHDAVSGAGGAVFEEGGVRARRLLKLRPG